MCRFHTLLYDFLVGLVIFLTEDFCCFFKSILLEIITREGCSQFYQPQEVRGTMKTVDCYSIFLLNRAADKDRAQLRRALCSTEPGLELDFVGEDCARIIQKARRGKARCVSKHEMSETAGAINQTHREVSRDITSLV